MLSATFQVPSFESPAASLRCRSVRLRLVCLPCPLAPTSPPSSPNLDLVSQRSSTVSSVASLHVPEASSSISSTTSRPSSITTAVQVSNPYQHLVFLGVHGIIYLASVSGTRHLAEDGRRRKWAKSRRLRGGSCPTVSRRHFSGPASRRRHISRASISSSRSSVS